MSNERNAGRKPLISEEQINEIEERYNSGESLSTLAKEYGVTRQALHKRLQDKSNKPVKIDWIEDGECVSSMQIDFKRRGIVLANYAVEISKLPFGFNVQPTWQNFISLLEEKYLKEHGVDEPGTYLVIDDGKGFAVDDVLDLPEDFQGEIPVFEFQKKDLILTRTDTDGFQMKAMSSDRRLFIKSQAVISGVEMQDWAVEIIASDLADQLGIPCVKQHQCKFAFGNRKWEGVYSKNFEIDGYTFLSFESLISTEHLSTKDDAFIRMGSLEKLEWCANQLARIGGIPCAKAEKYMIDLAVIDCLVGNVDRHTRNFGLFFNSNKGEYSIPLVFDNGMGLFQHDYYRDNYKSFEEAMNNVYVSPYGEDPFDFLHELNKKYHLKVIYEGVEEIHYLKILHTPFAEEYERRMQQLWQKLD
ncbi:helix-turn-helix domain-containing protein [Butyrivibrio fibrisolvens]|uniref:helix-turn-helix domain-containing protein n=1 Tax=Pseudobutyrivibrio ruminis TaxID=46206 RepID=UPI000419966F|nr:helix-turn-helix domain-containing protein [Pseudobutyrivibrio ruminis]MDC7279098.1 helix-turn-helix domain-containing protein [Butyrivibrio fibrisolvens]